MTKIIKNKLVRDLVPGYIEAKGQKPEVVVLEDGQFVKELAKKLVEEAQEVAGAIEETKERLIEEIADLYEVIESLTRTFSIEESEIIKSKKEKSKAHGEFNKKFYLVSIEDNN